MALYVVYSILFYQVTRIYPGCFLKSHKAKSGHLVDDVANWPCGPNFLVLAIRRSPQRPEFPWLNTWLLESIWEHLKTLNNVLIISYTYIYITVHILYIIYYIYILYIYNHLSFIYPPSFVKYNGSIMVYPQGLNGFTVALPLLGDVNEANLAQGLGGLRKFWKKIREVLKPHKICSDIMFIHVHHVHWNRYHQISTIFSNAFLAISDTVQAMNRCRRTAENPLAGHLAKLPPSLECHDEAPRWTTR